MKKFTAVIAAIASVALVACEDEVSAPAPTVAPRKAPVATAAAETNAAAGPTYTYQYNPIGKRDPFRSPVIETNTAGAMGPCSDPLCQWDLDQLSLVAVVTGDSSPIAMVQDPQGRGYIVRRNSQMGKQGGRVGQILRDQVIVNEQFLGPDGSKVVNPVSLRIQPDEKAAGQLDFLTGRLMSQ